MDFTADASVPKMYWTDATAAKIQRSSLDGTSIEDLINTGLINPGGLALDVINFKMCWTDTGNDKIQRANLDSTGAEDLVTPAGPTSLRGIALDISAGKMYWVDAGTDKVHRANLDGTVVEDLVTGLSAPNGIALDLVAGKMYWTDQTTNKIQRANMADGSVVEDLVTTGLTTPHGIALDVAAGKMYWTDSSSTKIQRSDLDGTGVEDLITSGLTDPRTIALELTPLSPYIWDGGGADSNWNTPENWSTDVVADVAIFNSLCAATCAATINVDPSVAGIEVWSTYTGTITQSAGIATTLGASGYIQAAGTFGGGDSAIDLNGPFIFFGGSFTSTSGTMSISGDVTFFGGTFTHNSGGVTLDGGDKTVDTGAAILNDVTLNMGANNLTVTGTMDVDGNLTITGADIFGGTIAVAGNVTTTDLVMSTNGTGTILFDGAGAQIFGAAGGTGTVPQVLINKSGGTLTIQDTIQLRAASTNWTHTAGTVDAGTSTVVFLANGGGGTVNAAGMSFNDVTFDMGADNLTVIGTMDVNGDLSFLSQSDIFGGTIAAAGNVTTIAANISNNADAIILFDGAGAQTLSASGGTGAVMGISINKSAGTLTIQDTILIDGTSDFTYSSGTVDAGTSTIVFTGNDKTVNAGTMVFNNVDLNMGGNNLTVTGTIDVNGNLTITAANRIDTGTIAVARDVSSADITVNGTGTVMLDGTGAQTITAAGGAEFPDGGFTINKASGTATLASDLVLDGAGQTLNVTSGTLDQSATFNLTSGPITVGAAGTLLNMGTGDLTLSGDVSNSGTITLNSNGAACGDAESILIRSSATPTQRLWSGSGTFTLVDIDVEDQAGTAGITVLSGTDTGNNGGNWTFAACPLLGPDPGTSLITAAPTSIPNDGTTTSTITVQLRDAQLINLISGSDTVVLFTDLGTLSGVTDNGDGTYTATLTSSTTGTATISGTVNGYWLVDTATVDITAVAWVQCDYQYGKKITIQASQVTADQTNFPVLINLSADTELAASARNDGFDIRFTSDNGLTQLSHQIERFDGTTGELVAWVNVSNVSSSINTDIYLYYGNPTATNQEDADGVWDSNYIGVWHLDEIATGTLFEYRDSTTNENHGTGGKDYGPYVPVQAGGQIGYGQTFDGVNDFIDVASSGWYDANWTHRSRIVVDASKVSGTAPLSNFPVLINSTVPA